MITRHPAVLFDLGSAPCSNNEANKSDRAPVPDPAENDAFFPSKYSLSQYVSPKTDFDGADYPNAYKGDKWKALLIATQQRYVEMAGGEFFSTGNHPVETLLPMIHLDAAGFDIDIATISGDPVHFGVWAFPQEHDAVKRIYIKYKNKLRKPLKPEELWGKGFNKDTPYLGVVIPGGHGVLNDVPTSAAAGKILRWAHENPRYYISLCHGPASILAADVGNSPGSKSIYEGYEIVVLPDSLDASANIETGYIPGKMQRLVVDRRRARGIKALNLNITGKVHRYRFLLTGDSPLTSNNLGKLAATTLVQAAN